MNKKEMEEQIIDLRDCITSLMKSSLELRDEISEIKLALINSISNPFKRLKIINKFAQEKENEQ